MLPFIQCVPLPRAPSLPCFWLRFAVGEARRDHLYLRHPCLRWPNWKLGESVRGISHSYRTTRLFACVPSGLHVLELPFTLLFAPQRRTKQDGGLRANKTEARTSRRLKTDAFSSRPTNMQSRRYTILSWDASWSLEGSVAAVPAEHVRSIIVPDTPAHPTRLPLL